MKKFDSTCLDERYSTTRLLTIEKPKSDLFNTVLFLPVCEEKKLEGGLRIKGLFKKSLQDKPLISIVSIVFNGAEYLEETILSVIKQSYNNVEYIIIDGGSTDGTLDIIGKYDFAIDYWVSAKDKGIYDAMNKGIDLVSGDWINFMNCGDFFYNNSILENIFKRQSYQEYQIIYGNQEVRYPSGLKRIVNAGRVDDLWKCSQFCHQASFVSSQYHKRHKFNTQTKIVADFEFFYLAWKNNNRFLSLEETICSFDASGVSDGGGMAIFWDIAQVRVRHGIRGRFLAYSGALYSKLKWLIRKNIWY